MWTRRRMKKLNYTERKTIDELKGRIREDTLRDREK